MHNLTSKAIEAFKEDLATANIPVDLVSGRSITNLTEKDIQQLSVERSSVSGNSISIGEARSFELTLILDNEDGKFDGVNFDGAKVYPRVISSGSEICPLGYFTIDGHENSEATIKLIGLDGMVKFNRVAQLSEVSFPITVRNLVSRACTACGVDSSKISLVGACNAEYEVEAAPDDDVLWRDIIIWCAELTGTCAYFDAEGYFRMEWYSSTGLTITAHDRYDHSIFQNDVVVRAVEIIDSDDIAYLAGEDGGFKFTIEGNALITHDYETVAANLGAKLIGFKHRPFSAEVLSMPNIFPLDMMTYVEPSGETHPVCITNITYTLNDSTDVEGAGESETTSGYASQNPLTKQQRKIVKSVVKRSEEQTRGFVEQRKQDLIRMNEIIANAMGLYLIEFVLEDGSTEYYFANKSTLEESSYILVFNAGGFAWTDKWSGSKAETVWQYGITRDGNAILNYLNINKLTAEQIYVETIVGAINDSSGESLLRIEADHMNINGAISANGTFFIDKDGFFTATGGNIAGLLITSGETEENGLTLVQKSLRTPSDDFHILITENEDGEIQSSEVLITSLICDTMTARTGTNRITLCYSDGGIPITAKLSSTIQQTIVTGLYMSTSSITITSSDPRFTGLLNDIKFSITATELVFNEDMKLVPGANSFTFDIAVKKGTSSTTGMVAYHNTPLTTLYFTETKTTTFETFTTDPINQYVAIQGDTVPWEDDTYSIGSDARRWKGGHFNSLYVGGKEISTPKLIKDHDTIRATVRNKTVSGDFIRYEDCEINVINFSGLAVIGITTPNISSTESDDQVYVFSLSSYVSKIYAVNASTRLKYDGDVNGSTHDAFLASGWNGTSAFVALDNGTMEDGFNFTVIGIK